MTGTNNPPTRPTYFVLEDGSRLAPHPLSSAARLRLPGRKEKTVGPFYDDKGGVNPEAVEHATRSVRGGGRTVVPESKPIAVDVTFLVGAFTADLLHQHGADSK
jgi:hypothetical protein